MLAKDFMTPDPLKVSTRESVEWIAELIRVHKIHQVPVVDASNRLVGIVTDRDIRSAAALEPSDTPLVAEDIMTTDVLTVEPNADLVECARLLHDHGFGALPVTSGGHVVGMISTRDLLRRFIELSEEIASGRLYGQARIAHAISEAGMAQSRLVPKGVEASERHPRALQSFEYWRSSE